jgi:hypothetical protein
MTGWIVLGGRPFWRVQLFFCIMTSMFDGYNTRFNYKGTNFLVQTQDKGLAAHYVESLIYKSGRLLTSKKTFYTSFLNSPNIRKMIGGMMEDQHKAILQEIADGKYDGFLDEGDGSK